jgi:signal peptidase I
MSTLSLFAVILLLNVLVSSGLLWLLARLFSATRASLGRALLLVLLFACGGILTNLLSLFLVSRNTPPVIELAISAACLIVLFVAFWGLFVRTLGTSRMRGAFLLVSYLGLSVILAVGLVFGIKPYLGDAYLISSNNDAPTLIGYHHRVTCPLCQGTAIVSAAHEMEGMLPRPAVDPRSGICTRCLKSSEFLKWEPRIESPDRILTNKLLTPQRWDLIVFIPPRQDSRHVSRLVGLPGETIQFKEKTLWIDGQAMVLPEEIRGLEYLPISPWHDEETRTWTLGPDEFFVVGDFSKNSSDSRDYGPVQAERIESIATVIYWPPSRWRILK